MRQTPATVCAASGGSQRAAAAAYKSFFDVDLIVLVRLGDQLSEHLQHEMRLGQSLLQGRNPILLALHDDLHDVPLRPESVVLPQPGLHHGHGGVGIPRGFARRELTGFNLLDQPLLQFWTVMMK